MQQFQVKKSSPPKSGLFGYLLFLTFIFFLLEISFLIQRGTFYLSDFTMVSAHLHIPLKILPGIIFFILAQIFVHVLFTVLIWSVARLIGVILRLSWPRTQTVGFSLWCVGLVTVILANEVLFANSRFANILTIVLAPRAADDLLLIFAGVSAAALFLALCSLTLIVIKKLPVVSRVILGLIFLSTTAGFVTHHQRVVDAATEERPNIILIGVDSLRPDFLGFMGGDKITPRLDEFLEHSAVFAQAITPQARTFPAWIDLLTGQYSKINGARYDLAEFSDLHIHQNTLPQMLHTQGYKTIFAMDETRFSNIDQAYGFDQVVTPPMGFNDFLLGTLNDFPMSNLLVNTALGKFLFPYSYGNRPVFITYDPDSFLNMLQPVLSKSRDKPLFLAVHFCLPHFPYFWASYSFRDTIQALPHYKAALKRTDEQVGDFLAMLQQDGLLKHSIVVLFSDHGEAMELHGDRATDKSLFIPGLDHRVPHFYSTSFDFEKINQSAGHGTDVLSMTQYHTVLAFRLYGLKSAEPRVLPQTVSLMDIKPTILSLLGMDAPNVNGSSLADYILTNKDVPLNAENDLFLESDFSPQAIHSVYPETRKLLFEGIDFFKINPDTTRLTVKKSMGDMIIASKQYADLYGHWILALYPQQKGVMMPILVNLDTGQWTNDLRIPFAQQSPAAHMLSALQKFYTNEITTVENTFITPSIS
jgi:arylsulfatase A-like enzyme